MHICPLFDGWVPHVGGPVLPACEPTVLIGGLPAARVGDPAFCVGPTDVIVEGSPTVLIGGQPAARLGDMTAHGGTVIIGFPTVLIGDGGAGGGLSGAEEADSGSPLDALADAASEAGDFLKGVGEGVVDGLTGMVKGLGSLAEGAYDFATDSQFRSQALSAAGKDLQAAGNFAQQAWNDPAGAAADIGNAAESALNKVQTAYQQAAADGHGAEFIGKAVGQTGLLVAGALIPGADEAEGAGLAGEAGAAADLAGDAGSAAETAATAGDAGRVADAAGVAGGAAEASGDAGAAAETAATADNAGRTADAAGVADDAAEARNLTFTRPQLQHAFKHAEDFGVSGNPSNATLDQFQAAIEDHVQSPDTLSIDGTYHGKPATLFVDPATGVNVIGKPSGDFVSGWKLSPEQLRNVMTRGKL
jgi:uncharacterized Zn-binding protein involved in type VI secretion